MKTIKDMPEHSRPREKLREKGVSALSDEELVAAILGMGTAGVVRAHDCRAGSRFDPMTTRSEQKIKEQSSKALYWTGISLRLIPAGEHRPNRTSGQFRTYSLVIFSF